MRWKTLQEVSLLPMKDQMESFVIANSAPMDAVATLPPVQAAQPFLELAPPPPHLTGGPPDTGGGGGQPVVTNPYHHPNNQQHHHDTIVLSADNNLMVPTSSLNRDAGHDNSPQTKRFYQVLPAIGRAKNLGTLHVLFNHV